jgi:hypothetical protein
MTNPIPQKPTKLLWNHFQLAETWFAINSPNCEPHAKMTRFNPSL